MKKYIPLMIAAAIGVAITSYSIMDKENNRSRSYQLQIINGADSIQANDSVQLWDGDRLIGGFKLDYDADPVSTLILEDNQ